jgi:hypothetical protein
MIECVPNTWSGRALTNRSGLLDGLDLSHGSTHCERYFCPLSASGFPTRFTRSRGPSLTCLRKRDVRAQFRTFPVIPSPEHTSN